jgi:hypothetical protein
MDLSMTPPHMADSQNPKEELFWTALLPMIARGSVVPIIGPDLLQMRALRIPGTPRPLRAPLATLISRRALARNGAKRADVRMIRTPDDAAIWYRAAWPNLGMRPFYETIAEVAHDEVFHVPPALAALASIDGFGLYVTTTWDPLLDRAISVRRKGAAAQVEIVAYSPKRPRDLTQARFDDLESEAPQLPPMVFHLFGQASRNAEFALTEEDMLEYLHSLLAKERKPERLIDVLARRTLLILGCRYPDWLARFVLRVTNHDRLSLRSEGAVLVDESVDPSLQRFLHRYAGKVDVRIGAEAFVSELARRWAEFRSTTSAGSSAPQQHASADQDSVFVSYAHEDAETARRVVDALRAAPLPVWFDEISLTPGVDWARDIHDAIGRCSLFIPILSRALNTDDRHYVFKEWRAAVDQAAMFRPGRIFIVPCVIDDLSPNADWLPEEFRAAQVGQLGTNGSLVQFVDHVRNLVRQYRTSALRSKV